MAQAIREVAWNTANDPQKCPVNRGSREQKSSPMRLLQSSTRAKAAAPSVDSRCAFSLNGRAKKVAFRSDCVSNSSVKLARQEAADVEITLLARHLAAPTLAVPDE